MKLSELLKVLSEANDVIIYKGDDDNKTLIYCGYVKNVENIKDDAEVVRVYPSLECHFVIQVKENNKNDN